MGNLTRKRTQLLFNVVDASSLTYDTAPTPDTLAIKNYNIFNLPGSSVKKFKKTKTFAGYKQAAVIAPDFAYPSDTSQFEWFLNIKGKTDLSNGKIDRLYLNDKTYQGYMGGLAAAVSGKIANADEKTLIDSMVTNINSDKTAPCTALRAGDDTQGYYLVLQAKDAAVKFDVGLEPKYGLIVQNGGITAFGADGATNSAAATLTSAGAAWATNALTGGYIVITELTSTLSGEIYLIASNTGTVITKTGNFAATETTLDFIVIQGVPAYPRMTLAEVQRIFPIRAMQAGMSAELFPNAAYTDWSKYYFKIERSGVQGAYALDGAGHLDSYIEEVECYVPTALAEASTGANWDDKIRDFLTNTSYVDPNGDTTPWGLAGS